VNQPTARKNVANRKPKTITLTATVAIQPITGHFDSCRQGTLRPIKHAEISALLGFQPTRYNEYDGDGKVTMEWKFQIGNAKFAIWDYKGSASFGQFSVFGNAEVLRQIFGDRFSKE
jgi:hypothetical protein